MSSHDSVNFKGEEIHVHIKEVKIEKDDDTVVLHYFLAGTYLFNIPIPSCVIPHNTEVFAA
jgi:hypothetical protein